MNISPVFVDKNLMLRLCFSIIVPYLCSQNWRNPQKKIMKKILLFTTLLFTQFAFSQVVDVFNYTGLLSANGWTVHSGTGALNTSASSLSYPGLAASVGNKVAFVSGNGEDVNKPITVLGDTAYLSFLISVPNTTGMSASGDYYMGIGGSAGATVNGLYARIYVRTGTAANTVNFGIGNSSGTATYDAVDRAIGTTFFVVVSLNKLASPSIANLYVNPAPGAAIPASPTITNSINTGAVTAFACVYLRQGGSTGNVEIDEIRAGSTFASVTPAGAAVCNISASGITSLTCNDATTGSNPLDDYLTFNLNPTGSTLGTTYTVSVPTGTITPTTGTYGAATSFQLQAGSAGAGNVTVTISDNGTSGCTFDQLITDPGACSSAIPVITMAPSSLTGFDHTVGTPSAEQTFTVSGLSLTNNITVTAPTNFQISLTTGTGFTNSLVLTQTGGVVASTTIYAIGNATAAGSFSGNILGTSTGALNDTVMVSGVASDYVYYTIDQVSTVDAVGVADSLDVLVELTGVVYCMDFDGNAGYSITLIDGSGSGINFFSFTDKSNYTSPLEGDSLRVFGVIDQYNGLLEVVVDSVEVLAQGVAIMAPTVVTTLDESTESQYIKMENLTLVTPIATFATGSSNVDVTDGTNTFVMRIDSDTDIPGAAAPQGVFSVTGVGGQFDSSSPYDSGYQIFPCGLASIQGACTTPSNATTPIDSTGATATASGATITYQWINCAGNTVIAGATNQSFTATAAGSYAVIVMDGNCSDTSACVALVASTNSLTENTLLNSISIFPNPVNDVLTVKNSSNSVITFEVTDMNGRILSTNNSVTNSTTISTSNWNSGVYFIHFTSDKGEAVMKVVK
jgi:hypothetical protein